MQLRPEVTAETLNAKSDGFLPGFLGLQTIRLVQNELTMRLEIKPQFLSPNGYLHAATVVALADTACGYACIAHVAPGASGFTTIELKTNFLGTARSGTLEAVAKGVHLGRNTHVWDAIVTDLNTQKTIALFRCTQMVLWPKQKPAG